MDIKISKIIRSRRRTVALEISDDSRLVIRAPFHVSEQDIHRLVHTKRAWINKRLIQQKTRTILPKVFADGESFFYLGSNYKLNIVDNPRRTLVFEDAFLLDRKYVSNARNEFIRWYKKQAESKILERVGFYSAITGLKCKSVNITRAETRWGSCSADGTLNFTWRLVMAPLKVIDSVVVHEITHLIIKNHSSAFWNKVALWFPEYKNSRKWLKENRHLMVI